MDPLLAIVWLHYRLAVNHLRGAGGIADLVSGALATVFLGVFALGFGVSFGAGTYLALRSGDLAKLRLLLHVAFFLCFAMGTAIPLLRGATDFGLDLSRLRVFPIRRRHLYLVQTASSAAGSDHLVYYPALAAVGLASAVALGPWSIFGLAILLGLGVCNVAWSQVIALTVQVCVRSRRWREGLAIGVFLGIVGVAAVASSLDFETLVDQLLNDPTSLPLVRAAAVLPPAAAAEALYALHDRQPIAALWQALTLGLWGVAGLAVGFFVFSRFHLGDRGPSRGNGSRRSANRRSANRQRTLDSRWLGLPDDVLAAAEKELRYLFRSAAGKLHVVVVPALGLLMALGSSSESVDGAAAELLFYGLVLYLSLLTGSFAHNAFAWDGAGAQRYFLTPVSCTRILAGKNLAFAAYNGLLFLPVLVAWLALSPAGALIIVNGVLILASTTVAAAAAGNFVSILFPAARDISTLKQATSRAGALLSFLAFSATVTIVGLTYGLPTLWLQGHWQPMFLALLVAIQLAAYPALLRIAARLLESRRESLIETLRGKG